ELRDRQQCAASTGGNACLGVFTGLEPETGQAGRPGGRASVGQAAATLLPARFADLEADRLGQRRSFDDLLAGAVVHTDSVARARHRISEVVRARRGAVAPAPRQPVSVFARAANHRHAGSAGAKAPAAAAARRARARLSGADHIRVLSRGDRKYRTVRVDRCAAYRDIVLAYLAAGREHAVERNRRRAV